MAGTMCWHAIIVLASYVIIPEGPAAEPLRAAGRGGSRKLAPLALELPHNIKRAYHSSTYTANVHKHKPHSETSEPWKPAGKRRIPMARKNNRVGKLTIMQNPSETLGAASHHEMQLP